MKGFKCYFSSLGLFVLPFFIALLTCFVGTQKASALTGDADISSAWNDYVWIYTDSGPVRWDSNTFGQILYNGMDSINGIAFNVSLDWYGDYGSYTTGTIEFTLEANGGWAVDGGNLSNILCEVWTASGQNQRQIPSTMGIKNSYYLSSVSPRKHAVDYQCNFEATNNLKPAYVYIRVGNNSNNNATIIPIIGGYNLNGGFIPSPRIRNVSYHYTTSNESLDSGNIQQIERNTSDLINGQKEIYDEVSEIENYLKDDSDPELSQDSLDAIADSAGWLPAGPVDSILTLPITFIQGIVNVLTGSDRCQALNVPLPFLNNQFIQLPCMRPILNQMGFLTIYEVVGGIISMFILWNTLKWLYEFIDKTLTFREDNSGLWGGL
ncbi:hypothetical protein IJH46_01825 [Candidatus Saccharibacteria bacterium]|nr:hypothetical protein [Candidatus Saccharibacteria bacterium]